MNQTGGIFESIEVSRPLKATIFYHLAIFHGRIDYERREWFYIFQYFSEKILDIVHLVSQVSRVNENSMSGCDWFHETLSREEASTALQKYREVGIKQTMSLIYCFLGWTCRWYALVEVNSQMLSDTIQPPIKFLRFNTYTLQMNYNSKWTEQWWDEVNLQSPR